MRQPRDGMTFKPIGLALAAVVAGVAPAAQAEAPALVRSADHGAGPARDEEDETLLLGPSAPVEPFSQAGSKPKQGDLFDL